MTQSKMDVHETYCQEFSPLKMVIFTPEDQHYFWRLDSQQYRDFVRCKAWKPVKPSSLCKVDLFSQKLLKKNFDELFCVDTTPVISLEYYRHKGVNFGVSARITGVENTKQATKNTVFWIHLKSDSQTWFSFRERIQLEHCLLATNAQQMQVSCGSGHADDFKVVTYHSSPLLRGVLVRKYASAAQHIVEARESGYAG